MLRQDNINELKEAVKLAEKEFNCKAFYISSIRDITATKNFWKDTKETIPIKKSKIAGLNNVTPKLLMKSKKYPLFLLRLTETFS